MMPRAGKHVLLLGGGHAHVEVVRQARSLGPAATVTLVSPSRWAPYSGMLPGHIAGRYRFEDFHIDLESLCRRAGVEFRPGGAVAIDADARRVTLSNGSALEYDLLSLDIGSTPNLPQGVHGGIAVKPIASFTARLGALDTLLREKGGPLHLAVIGQGVAGVEISLALHSRLARLACATGGLKITLVGRGKNVIPERSAMCRWLTRKALARSGVRILSDFDVIALKEGQLFSRDGRHLAVDEVVWTTSSGAAPWLRLSGLALDRHGFVRVDRYLRSISHPTIFAAGDIAALDDPRPKAGVFAVRAGPVLVENLGRMLAGLELRPFVPQRSWLVLLSLGNDRAIADKWGLAVSGRWVAAWKHWIDSRFVRHYIDREG